MPVRGLLQVPLQCCKAPLHPALRLLYKSRNAGESTGIEASRRAHLSFRARLFTHVGILIVQNNKALREIHAQAVLTPLSCIASVTKT